MNQADFLSGLSGLPGPGIDHLLSIPMLQLFRAHDFLAKILLALNDRLTPDTAEQQAHKMEGIDGASLYDKSEIG